MISIYSSLKRVGEGYTVDDIKSCITLRTLNYKNYGKFLIVGNAGFVSSTAGLGFLSGLFKGSRKALTGLYRALQGFYKGPVRGL